MRSALSAATACVVVAGHPQLPAYAIASALVYLFWLRPGQRAWQCAGAIVLGAAATLAVWWPMLGLIGRSTRVLALETATNDLALTALAHSIHPQGAPPFGSVRPGGTYP